jgi:hypothetical protein
MDIRSFVLDARQEGRKLELTDQVRLLQKLLQMPPTSVDELMAQEYKALVQLRDELQAKLGVRD